MTNNIMLVGVDLCRSTAPAATMNFFFASTQFLHVSQNHFGGGGGGKYYLTLEGCGWCPVVSVAVVLCTHAVRVDRF